ncbi:MAG TPA: aminotransferase class V-fold PLP-dependent enzyme [Methylomirabilota bacterium]|nr:aminotransferase class V-fold PLP-dependent enzyme [Methylomirabilota bacterium]
MPRFSLETIREEFPALRDRVFLDAACVSLASRSAVAAVETFLAMARDCPEPSATLHHIAMDDMRAAARPSVARLINAEENEIALVESTTHGLSIAAQAIPLESGDRVLLCDLEFMQVAIPWMQLASRGVELDCVASRNGEVSPESIAGRITPRTRVVAVSSVQWSNGFRCDLAALSRFCRERGVWLVVDATQQLGAVPIDVQQTPVDFLACGGHKWLNAPFGCGFLYIRRDAMPRLHPPLAGYLSVETPEGGWGAYFQTPSISPIRPYSFVRAARRFEVGGTANYPGAVGLAASLEIFHALGQENIAEHIFGLTDHLIAGLDALGVQIVSPRAREKRAGIVTFSLGAPEQNARLMDELLARRILVSVRYTSNIGGVRVSCHFYNRRGDVDALLNAVDEHRKP